MITQNEVFKIGKLIKPHGIKGEISFAFDNDIFDRVDCPYLICLIDGILVPFFIEEYRFKGKETALIKLEDIDSADKVRQLNGVEVYFPRTYLEDREEEDVDYSWNYFIGFQIVDEKQGDIGVIEDIDELTINTLFLVKNDDEDIIIPASEALITGIDDKNKILRMDLPEGLL
ncbi:ribosome maturation factor RimM [Viscerimonas tarda]